MKPFHLPRRMAVHQLAAIRLGTLLALLLFPMGLLAQDTLQVLERGPHHNRIQRSRLELDPASGNWVERKGGWTQLADGLNFYDTEAQAWAESRELIELTPTGAIARYGQHQVVFSANANDPNGAVDMLINHQVRLRSSILALRYFNPVDGRSVVLATVQDAQGELLPPNQIIYRNVFDNVAADIVYSVRISGIEGDLVLREVVPDPGAFGMPPEVTRL